MHWESCCDLDVCMPMLDSFVQHVGHVGVGVVVCELVIGGSVRV